ncbi:MAG TPA: hypothetical protein VK003_06945 [Oceanobacillus sp.]|jgi:hypothetical protein|nr:hypothetical protein [Oceanobacillus sp.]
MLHTPLVYFDRIIGCGINANASGERLFITQKISHMVAPLFKDVEPEALEQFLMRCRRMNLEAVSKRIAQIQEEDPDLPAEAYQFVVDFNFQGQDGKETRLFLVTHLTPLTEDTHELSIAYLDPEEVDAYLHDLTTRN